MMIRRIMMKKYKVRIYGLGIDATAIIPFDNEPTQEILENNVGYYLNNNLMKIERDSFFSQKKYTITYEEVDI
jgi:hypothetical protein|tara:strand:+ start:365 stop:583 length:219 start_codon:yes stop_codon:yes gene_type:complete